MSVTRVKSQPRGATYTNHHWVRDKFNKGEPLWIDGDKGDLHFQALIFSEPSDYGIKLGPVSKLHITRKGKTVYEYDRGEGRVVKDPDVTSLKNYVVKNARLLYNKESKKHLGK